MVLYLQKFSKSVKTKLMTEIITSNKCGTVSSNGNSNEYTKGCVFKLLKEDANKQIWLTVLTYKNFMIDFVNLFIGKGRWLLNLPHVKLLRGFTLSAILLSIFIVPVSLPTPKPAP